MDIKLLTELKQGRETPSEIESKRQPCLVCMESALSNGARAG